jgi:hypothetical protein
MNRATSRAIARKSAPLRTTTRHGKRTQVVTLLVVLSLALAIAVGLAATASLH